MKVFISIPECVVNVLKIVKHVKTIIVALHAMIIKFTVKPIINAS